MKEQQAQSDHNREHVALNSENVICEQVAFKQLNE